MSIKNLIEFKNNLVEHALENAAMASMNMAYQEKANTITHGIGTILSIIGLVILLFLAITKGNIWQIISFSIYGTSLILLYLSSTIYHGLPDTNIKRIFQKFDHSAIFLLIAGSYTPITLISLHGSWGWTLFGLVWVIALTGISMKAFFFQKTQVISVVLYVVMGLLILVAIKPLLMSISINMFVWIIVGGLFYLTGMFFFFAPKIRYHHAIWHLFVLGGSISHFLAVLLYLT
jgi:hemolysin III